MDHVGRPEGVRGETWLVLVCGEQTSELAPVWVCGVGLVVVCYLLPLAPAPCV